MKKLYIILLFITFQTVAQTDDAKQLRTMYDAALVEGKAYHWLNYLSNQIGGRLSGSVQAQQAVDYTKTQLDSLGLDRVWLQEVMVPKWEGALLSLLILRRHRVSPLMYLSVHWVVPWRQGVEESKLRS